MLTKTVVSIIDKRDLIWTPIRHQSNDVDLTVLQQSTKSTVRYKWHMHNKTS